VKRKANDFRVREEDRAAGKGRETMYRYRVISEVECEPTERAIAWFTAKLCARKLGIEAPRLDFIVEDPTGPIEKKFKIAGATGPTNRLFVLSGLSSDQIVRTVAHEMEHRRWYQRGQIGSSEWAERSANLFELEFWGVRQRDVSVYEALCKIEAEMDAAEIEPVRERFRERIAARQATYIKPKRQQYYPSDIEFFSVPAKWAVGK
jgi:hypothetical protein